MSVELRRPAADIVPSSVSFGVIQPADKFNGKDEDMNQLCRISVAVVLFIGLPIYAHAGQYKCVDEKTKAVTYSGTPCASGDVRVLNIYTGPGNSGGNGMTTEQANEYYGRINQGTKAQAGRSDQSSRRCEPSAAANWEVQQAEDALRVAKNSENRTGPRAVREAQANLETARDRRDNACDPAAAQQAPAAREAKRAAEEDARKQAAEQRRLQLGVDEVNRKLDSARRDAVFGR
jgi:hypothetical protein